MAPEDRKKPTKIVFLDFDGVICTVRAHLAYSNQILMRHLDPVAVRMVYRLCVEADAQIVVSSTWRLSFKLPHIFALLCNAGMPDVPFHQVWRTDDRKNGPRGYEIQAWLDVHKPDAYVILDDDSDFLEHQKPHLVLTDSHDGFLTAHYLQAKKILGVE